MFQWNKELLLKRRANSKTLAKPQEKDTVFEENQNRDLESCISHLRKLIYLFFAIKVANEERKRIQDEIKMLKPLPVPNSLATGNQIKLIKIINRRVKNVLMNLGDEGALENNLDQCYQRQAALGVSPNCQQFFNDIQGILLSELFRMRRKTIKLTLQSNADKSELTQRKISMKESENQIIRNLYSIIQVIRIQALACYMETLDFSDNLSLIEKQAKTRNSKIRQQIQAYDDQYKKRNEKKKVKSKLAEKYSLSISLHKGKQNSRKHSLSKSGKQSKSSTTFPKIDKKNSSIHKHYSKCSSYQKKRLKILK